MAITLAIELPFSVYLPGESVRVELIVANVGTGVRPVPMPDARLLIDIDLRGPSGALALRCAIVPPLVSLGDGDTLETEPDDEIAMQVVLPASAAELPGEYTLRCALDTREGRLHAEPVVFRRDAVVRAQIAVSRARGEAEARGWPCHAMVRGEHVVALLRAELGWSEDWPHRAMAETASERIATLGLEVSPIRTMAARVGAEDWIAWAAMPEGQPRLCVAALREGFAEASVAPADGLTRVLRDVLPSGVGCDVAVLGRGLANLSLFRFALGETHGVPLWTTSMPAPSDVVTVARGIDEHADRTAIAVAVDTADGVVLHYAVATGDAPPARFDSVLVGDAKLVGDTSLAVAIDRRGNGHVALVAMQREPTPALLLARIAFGSDAMPRLDRSAIAHSVISVPAPAVAASASFFIDDVNSRWLLDWAVLLEDGRCAASRRRAEPHVFSPELAPSLPLEVISLGEHAMLAAHDGHGHRRFIGLG